MNEIPTEFKEPVKKIHADSLVVVNTGDGRGKSSSAWGIMLRALGRDWKVAVVQYMKSGKWKVGEEAIGIKLGVDWWHIGAGFTWLSEDLSEDAAIAQEAWNHSKSVINSGNYELVILDEITYPINFGWIPIDEVISTIQLRPRTTNIVITGRNAPEQIMEIADTVSRVDNVKHAFQKGIMAKKGIDFQHLQASYLILDLWGIHC